MVGTDEDGGTPRVHARRAERPSTCRCGTRVPAGGDCVEVVGLSPAVQPLFRDLTFCSTRCVRANFLEDLGVLESLDTADATRQVTDLRETYFHLAAAFAHLLSNE